MASILYLIKGTSMQSIQMKLSKKLKTCSKVFYAFSEVILNFEHFEKKYDPHRLYISKIEDCARRA